MMILYFLYGLSFGGLGLAAYLQRKRGGDFPLRELLPWLAAFGFASAATAWVEMFMINESSAILNVLRMILHPMSGLLLLIFGWGIFAKLQPLPSWMIFVPGLMLIPAAYVVTYALTTFVTPSPLEIPIDIWSRYLLYLPGSILAGLGFLRQWRVQRKIGYHDVASLMLGAGLAFVVEAFVVGLVVPAAPYGPASYYNYDRVVYDAFAGEAASAYEFHGLTGWLDYESVLDTTGIPIQAWRTLSAVAVMFFVVRGLDVFEAIQKRHVRTLQQERDRAQQAVIESQISARETAESWSNTLIQISSRIAELEDVDDTLCFIVDSARRLLNADFMGLALIDGDYDTFVLKCYATEAQNDLTNETIPITNPVILSVIETQQPCCPGEHDMPDSLEGVSFFTDKRAAALAVVPLKLDTRSVGALWVARFEKQAFRETDVIWLNGLADQVVITIKHGLMTSQLQSLSVIDERGRIAREMHDGLAQVLGYMNVQVQTLEAFLQKGKLDKVQSKLDQMRDAVQIAHADVRENILSLRTTLDADKGVITGIQEYLEAFGMQAQIATQFTNHIEDELELPPFAEVQLVCILREALTNVRKHANATNVSVVLMKQGWSEDAQIVMAISDDGVGFGEYEKKRHFGLQTMTERAQSVGGTLLVSSSPGEGTQIECKIPCLRQERLKKPRLLAQV